MQYGIPISKKKKLVLITHCMCINYHTSLVLTLVPIYTPIVDASIGSKEPATAVLHLTLIRHLISEMERAYIRTHQC